MTGLLTSIIASFLQLVGQESKAAIQRRKAKELRAKKKREKLVREMNKRKAAQEKARLEYEAKQKKFKEDLRIAREKWRLHWEETRPAARPLDDNPFDEGENIESRR